MAKQASPSWSEFSKAIDDQSEMFRKEMEGLRRDIKDAVKANGDAIVQGNVEIREWVKSLKSGADTEHQAIRTESQLGDKILKTRVDWLYGILAVLVSAFVAYFVDR